MSTEAKNTPELLPLYYHQTDGGAEYLSSEAVPGTKEGAFPAPYVVRLDGHPCLLIRDNPIAAPEPSAPHAGLKRQQALAAERDRLRESSRLLLEALELAEVALLNCVPIVPYPGDGPLVSIRNAIANAHKLSEGR